MRSENVPGKKNCYDDFKKILIAIKWRWNGGLIMALVTVKFDARTVC